MIRSVCLKMTLLVLLIHMALPAQAAIRSLSPVSDFLNPRDQQASWKFKLNKLTILASEESSGDEPYFMMIGFKVTNIADPATVQVFSNILQHVSKKSLMNNTQAVIPPSAGEISFGDVNEDMFGLLGVVVIAFESDATGWSTMERIQGDIKAAIRETLVGVTTDPLSVNINSLNLSKIQTAITKNVSSLLANSYAFDIDDPIGMTTHIYLKVPAVTTNILRQEVLDLVYRKEDFPTALPGVVNDLIFSDAVYQVDAQMMRTWTHPDVAPAELTAPEVNGRSLTLSWIDRTSNETHFEVYDLSRNVVVDRPPRYTGRTARVSAPEMSGILPNQTYRFQVKACKDNFCSPASNILTVRTPNTLPGVPVSLTAVSVTGNQIELAWVAAGGNPVSSYQLAYYRNGMNYQTRNYPVTQTGVLINGLKSNELYQFHLRACNETGCSIQARSISVRTPLLMPVPAAPTGLRLQGASGSSVGLQWNDNSNDEQYFVLESGVAENPSGSMSPADPLWRSPVGIPQSWSSVQVVANQTTHVINHSSGTIEYYRIKACNAGGCSAYSNTLTAY